MSQKIYNLIIVSWEQIFLVWGENTYPSPKKVKWSIPNYQNYTSTQLRHIQLLYRGYNGFWVKRDQLVDTHVNLISRMLAYFVALSLQYFACNASFKNSSSVHMLHAWFHSLFLRGSLCSINRLRRQQKCTLERFVSLKKNLL